MLFLASKNNAKGFKYTTASSFLTTIQQSNLSIQLSYLFSVPDNISTNNKSLPNSTFKQAFSKELTSWDVIQIIIEGIIFITGVSGNGLIITTVIQNKKLRNLQNYYLLNLAFSDLVTLLLILPMFMVSQYLSWPFGEFVCKYFIPIADCIPAVSILSMIIITIDRYRVIIYTMKSSFGLKIGLTVISLLWVVSYLTVGLPLSYQLGVHKVTPIKEMCYSKWKNKIGLMTYYYVRIFLFYFLPSAVILVCWLRVRAVLHQNICLLQNSLSGEVQMRWINKQRKLMKMFFLIFLVFLLCFLPFNTITILLLSLPSFKTWNYCGTVKQVANICVFASSACNPIILYILSQTFRCYFQKLFPFLKLFYSRRRPLLQYDQSSFFDRVVRRRSTNNTLLGFDIENVKTRSAKLFKKKSNFGLKEF